MNATSNKKRAKAKKRAVVVGPRRARMPALTGRLDAGALAHRRLLLDPCNAPLAGPVYQGAGTGQFRRHRVIIDAEGDSVEGCYVFQPGTNTLWKGSHVAGTAGTTYTFNANFIFNDPSVFNAVQELRVVAACVKVRYVGTEAERSGTIGLLASPAAYQYPNTQSTAAADTTATPVVHRTGEVQHEVKFIPGIGDEEFRLVTFSGGAALQTHHNGTMTVVYRATPARKVQFEVTAVYEVSATSAGVNTTVAPASSVTLSQLLRSMGPVANWAYGSIVAPTIRAAAGAASSTFASSVAAAAKAVGLITL